MQLPNTRAGRLTENIMAAIARRLPDMKTQRYNQITSAVMAEADKEFQPIKVPAHLAKFYGESRQQPNYRDLLVKYCAHLAMAEGIDFATDANLSPASMMSMAFSEEDRAVLEEDIFPDVREFYENPQ